MSGIITSADGIFVLTVTALWNAPLVLENWATDRAWETEAVEMAEFRMSIDGKLNKGFVPRPITQSLNFSAGSSSLPYFEALITGQRKGRQIYTLGAELTLPSLGRKYTFINGGLGTGSVAPNGGGVLEDRAFSITWEDVFPAGI
ncbi:phage tail fiber protein [Gluconobacter albidus]|uniref:Phage tail protein n=1 Tax=Gluconobacter albidus TaxID=318683 RepID=A0AAW3R0J6_9PROT|nr:hypothetical protein [Gluconobacter albidus]KXV39470.1 hypothetical protein AD941_05105 [Gluconobacter albidus]GBQ90917.1 hypothetical protein AA3250_2168 [Gluconobacter albidus NBRC 3250]GLQ69364.1 hypothetical protein GCM10007866_18150 [Gluconobacter albidus]